MDRQIDVQIGFAADATLQASARTRSNFSVPYLLAAASFSRRVKTLEDDHDGEPFGEFWESIHAEATACVLLTVAALESYINELFLTADAFPEFRPDVLAKLWELTQQKPILDKYDFVLVLKAAAPLDRGQNPHQDVAVLLKLRNALVHFKPEWFDEQVEHKSISNALAPRIPGSAFLPNEPLFPRGWANHGCTAWAVNSAIRLILELEDRAGVPARLKKFAERIKP